MLDRLMAQVVLDRACVVAVIRELVAARMPQHVNVNGEADLGPGGHLNEKQKTHCSAAKEKLTAVQRRNGWNRQAIVLVFVRAIPENKQAISSGMRAPETANLWGRRYVGITRAISECRHTRRYLGFHRARAFGRDRARLGRVHRSRLLLCCGC